MGWKLRKDKLKADEPQVEPAQFTEAEPIEAVTVAPEPHEVVTAAPAEPHELSWDEVPHDEQPVTALPPAEPIDFDDADAAPLSFDDDVEAAPEAVSGPTYADAPALGSVYALEPEAVAGPAYSDMPEVAPESAYEAVTVAPPPVEAAPEADIFHDPEFAPEPPQAVSLEEATPTTTVKAAPEPLMSAGNPAFDPDTVAPALITTDTDSGLPRVAPFIVDAPATAQSAVPEDETRHLILRLGNLSATFPLIKDVTVIGRPDSKLHYYPDIEIELDDAVSRRHAEVIHRGSEYYLADAGSTNGTMLNGEPVPAHKETPLMHGDRIRLGERAEIIFE